jgi:hypothetical protein
MASALEDVKDQASSPDSETVEGTQREFVPDIADPDAGLSEEERAAHVRGLHSLLLTIRRVTNLS